MRTTIRDVAKLAGVSAMAVSAVLNGTGKNVTISPEKAERIRQAAEELQYHTNHLARSFRTKRTGQIGVVFQQFSRVGADHPYHSSIINGIVQALFPKDYTLSLCPKLSNSGAAGFMADGRFDGILWCRPNFDESSLKAIQGINLPIVMMHVPPGLISGVPTFCADNDGAMRQVVSHLVSLGHERIAFVIDPVSVKSVEGQARANALLTAALRAELPKPDVIVLGVDHSVLARYGKPNAPHTALICFSDELAGFVLKSCADYGVSVPGDVSVVGFDSSPFCETTTPRLTSVNQPVEQIALAATNHLLTLIQQAEEGSPKSPTTASVYECGLDVRDSTSRPRTH